MAVNNFQADLEVLHGIVEELVADPVLAGIAAREKKKWSLQTEQTRWQSSCSP